MPVGYGPSQGDGSMEWKAKLPQCPVCLDAFESDSEPSWLALQCGHTIHDLCWQQQLQYRPECPTCKCKIPRAQQKGLKLYLDVSLVSAKFGASAQKQQQTPGAGLKGSATAPHPAEAALREVNQKLHAVLRDKQEQAEYFNKELSRLQGMVEAMQEQQQAQADKVNKLKSKLTEQKQHALIEHSRLQQEVDRAVEVNRELQADVASKQRAVEATKKELVQLKIQLEKANLTLGGYERNKMAKKLANLPTISDETLRELCCTSSNGKLDVDVLAAALVDVNKRLKEQQKLRTEAEAAQDQARLESDKLVAGIQRETARQVAEQQELANKYRRELNDVEYHVATLEQRLLDAGLPVPRHQEQHTHQQHVQQQPPPAASDHHIAADTETAAGNLTNRQQQAPCTQHQAQLGEHLGMPQAMHQRISSAFHTGSSASFPAPSGPTSHVVVDLTQATPDSMEEVHCSSQRGVKAVPSSALPSMRTGATALASAAAVPQQQQGRTGRLTAASQPNGIGNRFAASNMPASSALAGPGMKRKAASDVLTNQPLKRAAEVAASAPPAASQPAADSPALWSRPGLAQGAAGNGSFMAKKPPDTSNTATMARAFADNGMAHQPISSLDRPGGLSKPHFKKVHGNSKPHSSKAQQRSIMGFLV